MVSLVTFSANSGKATAIDHVYSESERYSNAITKIGRTQTVIVFVVTMWAAFTIGSIQYSAGNTYSGIALMVIAALISAAYFFHSIYTPKVTPNMEAMYVGPLPNRNAIATFRQTEDYLTVRRWALANLLLVAAMYLLVLYMTFGTSVVNLPYAVPIILGSVLIFA